MRDLKLDLLFNVGRHAAILAVAALDGHSILFPTASTLSLATAEPSHFDFLHSRCFCANRDEQAKAALDNAHQKVIK